MAPTTRRKILIVTASSDIGGSERQVLHLLAGLDRSRFQPELLSLSGKGLLTDRAQRLGIPASNVGGAGPLVAAMRARAHVRRAFPDTVYLFGLRTDAILRATARRCGSRVISAIRNTDPWRKWHHVALDRMSAKHVNLFISNSQAGKESRLWRERFSADRIAVVLNGIELPDLTKRETLRREFRAKHGIAEDATLIGLVANYRPQKGHRVALRAFAKLHERHPNAQMVFAGEDFMNGAIAREVIRRGLGPVVSILGHQKDLNPLYAALDLFILPSDYEGTPNTLMEAMAWELPCIATAVGGIPEVLREEDGGILIPARDPARLARAMHTQIRTGTPLCPALRARIDTEFSISAMVRRHEELFWNLH